MSAIDERIVSLKFDNAQFKAEISTTLGALQKLNQGLKLDGASRGLDDLSRSASRFSLAGMQSGVDTLVSKFGVLGVVGITAIANIANRAVNAGLQLTKSLTIGPILDGYREYETKLNSIQTILANTGKSGAKGLAEVTKTLNDLNTYSDKTIYNFGEMAKNIGTFTAAGVSLDVSAKAIKGIANLAALSGSNSQQASSAMYQLSQAVSANKVSQMDWISVNNAGMGGKVFQKALFESAVLAGKLKDVKVGESFEDWTKKGNTFRKDILDKGIIDGKLLTDTLNQFTGDMTKAQLKAKGFTDAQADAILKQAKVAQDAATKVKTFSQLLGTLKESIGSGWAQSFEIIFGNFNQAKELFTGINDVLGGFINRSAETRNKVLADWAKMGGRTALIKGIGNVFKALGDVVKPIGEAFRDIFPATTGAQLANLSKGFLEFTKGLRPAAETIANIKSTFAGVFALLDIGRMIVVAAAKAFFSLFQGAGDGASSFLGVTANIGDFIVKVRNAIKEGTFLQTFFGNIAKVIRVPIELLGRFVAILKTAFSKIDFGNIGSSLSNLFSSLGGPMDSAGSKVGNFFTKLRELAKTGIAKFKAALSQIGEAIGGIFKDVSFDDVLRTIQTGLFAGLVLLVGKFVKGILKALRGADPSGGLFSGIKDSFEQLTGTLKSMQQTLKAATLLEIAIALGILTASVVALSKIDSAALTKALTAMTVMFTQLGVSLAIFGKISGGVNGGKLATTSAALILLAVAVRILASAVKQLAGLNWEELSKGLVGVGGLLVGLALFTKFADVEKGGIKSGAGLILLAVAIKLLVGSVKSLGNMDAGELAKGLISITAILAAFAGFSRVVGDPGKLLASGVALIAVAAAMKIMASAMKDFAGMSWEEIAKGLSGMAGSLIAVAAALALIPPTAPLQAAGIAIVAAALLILADATEKFGKLDWDVIGKGLTAMAGALVEVGLALALIPPTAPLQAAGIAIVAGALAILAPVLERFGKMDWQNIGKALTVLAGALGIIAVAMMGMTGALPGAAALIIVAGALAILTPVLIALGNMSWESIAKGLITLAAAFVIIGVAGLLLGPVTPAIIAVSGAIALLGVAVLLAGVGVLAFGIGLGLVAAAGMGAVVVLTAMVKQIIKLLPEIVEALGKVLVQMLNIIIKTAPLMAKAMTTVIQELIKAAVKLIPQVVDAIFKLATAILNKLVEFIPKLVNAGFKMLEGVLKGIRDNIPKIVPLAADIIVKFLNAIGKEAPKVIDAGVKLIIDFVNGVADAIDKNSTALGEAGGRLGVAIVKGIAKAIAGGIGEVTAAAGQLAKNALNSAKSALGIHSPSKEFQKLGEFSVEGFVIGLEGNRDQIKKAFADIVGLTRTTMKSSAEDVAAAKEKLEKLTNARVQDKKAIAEARVELAQAGFEHTRAGITLSFLTDKTKNHQAALFDLSKQQDANNTKLDAANEKLKQAIQLRDDYAKGVATQLDTLPDFANADATVDTVKDDLNKKLIDLEQFKATLDQLRKLGLNDRLYKELVAKGPAAMKFATDLLAAGQEQIKVFNALSDALSASAIRLADKAARDLYQGGVNAALGLVNGLKSKKDFLEGAIGDLIDSLVATVKSKLKIKSPSRVFTEIGAFSVQGFANGLNAGAPLVGQAADNIGKAAILGMSKTISGIADKIADKMDTNPTITPVLDLSGIRRSTSDLDRMLAGKAVTIDSALSAATDASRGFDVNQAAQEIPVPAVGDTNLEFNQYNSSPKALSAAEIYRKTRNQLSTAKEALK